MKGLCKAKSKDDGEWVEGYYVICRGHHYILPLLDITVENYGFDERYQEWVEIDPETLCQYTGLTDKNGNRIWENDIIKVHQFLFDGNEYENEIIVSIEYMSEMMCFGANMIKAEEIKRNMGYEGGCTEKVVIPFNDLYGLHEESFEVIGNVFDNPELLKGD